MGQRIARFTHAGVADATISVHPFATGDGLGLELTRFRRGGDDPGDVVLLIHGLTTSSDMYIMPEHTNMVNYLHDHGFTDVWALDFRMSGRFPYDTETHRHTLDDVARHDHPAALAELRRHVGDRRVHVIAHCLGSVSFAMALFAGTVSGIASMVSNSVALTPRTNTWSKLKLRLGPALMEYVLGPPFVDPRFGHSPFMTRGWMLSKAVSVWHRRGCGQPACHMLSFMWGGGKPIYTHAKMSPVTHGRLPDLFGAVGFHYYRHMHKMVKAGRAVRYDERHADLPEDYLQRAAEVDTPILFLTGDRNHVFADSNIVCHRALEEITPGLHELEILDGYGHQDAFMGKDVHEEVFPQVLDFLKRKAG